MRWWYIHAVERPVKIGKDPSGAERKNQWWITLVTRLTQGHWKRFRNP